MVRPVTNHDLDALLVEAGYDGSHAAFARQINLAGWGAGVYRYDGPSVYWWLRGRRPESRVQELMAEVLSRKLVRTVRVDELGFGAFDAKLGLVYPSTVAEAVDTATDFVEGTGVPARRHCGGPVRGRGCGGGRFRVAVRPG